MIDKLDGGSAGFAKASGEQCDWLVKYAHKRVGNMLDSDAKYSPDGAMQAAGLFAIAGALDRLTAMVEMTMNAAMEKEMSKSRRQRGAVGMCGALRFSASQ